MVVIRLSRRGVRKRPFYNIVVTDSRRPRDSGSIERIGYFNPIAKGQETRLHIDQPRVDHWLSHGVKLSPRVHSLVTRFNQATNQATTANQETTS